MEQQKEYCLKKQNASRLLAFGQIFTGFALVLVTLLYPLFQPYVAAGSWVCFMFLFRRRVVYNHVKYLYMNTFSAMDI